MTKKTAHIVNQQKLKNMAVANDKNKDLDATIVSRHLSGSGHTIKSTVNNIGFNYGFRRAIQSGDFVSFLAIANLSSKVLRTIGLDKPQHKLSIIESVSI